MELLRIFDNMMNEYDRALFGSPFTRRLRNKSEGDTLQRRRGNDALTEWRPFSVGFPATSLPIRADIQETDSEYQVVADVPGLSRNDINIEVVDGVLYISGERHEERTTPADAGQNPLRASSEVAAKPLRVERYYGSFERRFPLPSNVSEDNIRATCTNGVLTVYLPKTEDAGPSTRRIQIEDE